MSILVSNSCFRSTFCGKYILCTPCDDTLLHKEHNERLSNVDALIGRVGVVIEDIKGESNGYVKIDGDEWRAVSCDSSDILNGERVRVVKMDSLVVTVERLN